MTTHGGIVTSWRDASPSNIELSPTGDPTLSSNLTPSGLPGISFDGDGDTLGTALGLGALPSGREDRTIFFVVDYLDVNGRSSGVTYGDDKSNKTFGLVTGGSSGNYGVQGWGGQNDFHTSMDGITPGWAVQSAVLGNDVLSQYLNGGLIDTDTHAFNTTLTQLILGAHIGGAAEGEMNIAAVLIYDRALNQTERAEVDSYLNDKYLTNDGINDIPIATGDILAAEIDATTELNILENDYDDSPLDGSTITIIDGPDHGTIDNIDPTTGLLSYTHDGSSGNTDSFTYQLTDAEGAISDVATVSLEIGTLPLSLDGFTDEAVVGRGDFSGGSPFFLPISMAFLPDNRMLLLSKDGEIRIIDPETGSNNVYMTINNIDSGQERGLLDITLDPDFTNNGYFYLYYTPNNPENARIARFEHQENSGGLTSTGALNTEFTVWEDTDGYPGCCHYGGGLDFGPDGKIWLTTSDKFLSTTPGEGAAGGNDIMLDPAASSGKIIRVNPDGTVPDGTDGWAANPWADPSDGFNDYAWAYGLRNPFRARWDEDFGQMYIGEVGGNQQLIAHDDIHTTSLDQAGAFYGWPFYEGTPNTYVNAGQSPQDPNDFPLPDNDLADATTGDFYSAPIFSIDHQGQSTSITGGEVYRGDMFPEEWGGVYFYGDYTNDFIKYLVLDDTGTEVLGNFDFKPSAQLPGTTNEIVSLTIGEDGALYYAMIASGEVRRVTFDGNAAPEIQTAELSVVAGGLPLEVTVTASVTDAEGDAMTYQLNFGDGTVVSDVVAPDGLISVQHTYITDGRYAVSLSVSDPAHTVLSQAFEVEAGDVNEAPLITDEQSDLSIAGAGTTEITFTANASDADDDTMNYIWHFGDGNSASGVVGPSGDVTAAHTYATEGSFDAYLEVTDGAETTFSSNLPIQVGTADQVPVTDGLVLLLQSDIKIGLGAGNTVVAWLDGSGSGNNLFAQGDPTLVQNATPTGQAALAFDGQDDLLQRINASDTIFNLPDGDADRTIFFVVDYESTNGRSSGVAYGNSVSNQTFGLVADGSTGNYAVQGWGGWNDFDSATEGLMLGWAVQSAVLSNDVLSQYLDGGLIDTDTHAFNTVVNKLVLGAHIKGAAEGEMQMAAVLIYDRALDSVERQQVEDFLQLKYITDPNNNAPIAAPDAITFVEDTVLAGDVLADNGYWIDSDPDGDPLSVTLLSDVANGALVLNNDGTFNYTPDENYSGADSFVYRLSDGRGGVDQATVTLTGTPVDDPAVATDDAYDTAADTTLVVAAAAGVLANDADAEGDPFTASLLTDVSDGTLAFNADGSFDYTPDAGFLGEDSFTYQVTGGDSATVTLTVGGPQGVPVTSGLVAAYESGQNVSLAAGNTVAGWLDGSGRGNDLVAQGDPTLVQNATPTGQAALAFDGVGDLLERINATDTLNGLSSGAADRTIFFVADYQDHNGISAGVAYGDGAHNQTFGLVSSWDNQGLSVQGYGGRNDFDSGVDAVSEGWLVQSVILDDDEFDHYLNGQLIDSGNHTFNTDLERLVLGEEIRGKGESELEIGALLIYDRALDEAERQQVETYLQQTYIDDSFLFA
ncbi:Ig-like domain-containing protein [Rhodobacteraceae bacterium KMM 6894]|nr:Ig-like domain-containing protein [Rhodobacteraceae bacterium KMM 6894]